MTFRRESRNIAVILLAFGVLALTLLSSAPAQGQAVGATLSGTVLDASRAVILGAQITTKNVGTGISVTVTTDAAGFYTVPNLLPGAYVITVTAPGFSTEVRTGITLTVGHEQVLNLTLQVGQVSQTVRVTGEQPDVDLASSAISGNVDERTVVELPLNGRDWTQLAALEPGVSSLAAIQDPVASGYNRGNRGYGTQMSINGGRPGQNNYRINGISVNDYVNSGPGSVLGSSLGVDAISEFSVLSTNYSAEYGRTSGGVINAITRSGTNGFHGDVYEFLRNSALDSATYVDNAGGIAKPPFRQNQFGAAVGGPIQKDRTFFFADYEGVRQSLGLTNLDTVPSQDARNGILSFASPASFPTGCVATSVANQCQLTVSPAVAPFLGLWPLPNAGLIAPGNTGTFAFAAQQVATENFVTGRVDHKFSDRDSIFGSYQYDKAVMSSPDSLDTLSVGNRTFRQFLAVEETHVFSPQLVNNFRFGFNRSVASNNVGIAAINPLADDLSLSAVPGRDNPSIAVSGITSDGGGLNSLLAFIFHYNSFQEYDDVFLTKGKHSLKFGGGVERIQSDLLSGSSPGGAFTFGSLASFLTNQGQGTGFSSSFPSAYLPHRLRSTIVGAYLEDDIRWRPNLTINLGMRYEMSTVPTDAEGRLSTLTSLTSPLPICGVLIAGCAGIGPAFQNPTYRNFEPRVGFAWDPFHTGKTSVRGGFGIYDVLPLPYELHSPLGSSAPFVLAGSVSNFANDEFPTGAFGLITASPHLRTEYIEPDPKRNYVMQWNLNVQRELSPDLTAMIAYIGSRGVHMRYTASDVNIVIPTLTPQGYMWPCGGTFSATGLCSKPGTGTLNNTTVGQEDALLWNEDSFYDALELQVTKRLSHGLQIQGSYTWGRSIDEGSSGFAGDAFQNGIASSLAWLNPRLDYGPSDYNITQKLVIDGTWQLPSPHSLPSGAGWLLGGWQLGGIYTAQTGTPFSLMLGGDPLGEDNTHPYDFPDRLIGPGCQSPVNPGNFTAYVKVQCFAFPDPSTRLGNSGRNSLTGPGLMDLDLSLFKNNYITRISENFNVQFRAEVFNSLNRANMASPTDRNQPFNSVGNPVAGFGLLDITATPAREIQFALKVIW